MEAARVYILDQGGVYTHVLTATMTFEYLQAELFLSGAPGIIRSHADGAYRVLATAWPREPDRGVPWDPVVVYAEAAFQVLEQTDFRRNLDNGFAPALADDVVFAATLTLSADTGVGVAV